MHTKLPSLTTALCTALLCIGLISACSKDTGSPPNKSPVAATPDVGVAPPGKLPSLAYPTAYRVSLTLDPRREAFAGKVEIDLVLERESDVIWLHGKSLRVERVTARRGRPSEEASEFIGSYREVLESGVAELRFPQPLAAGELTLSIVYSADYDRNLAGLFKVEEQGENYVLAKSESIQARRYLPSFDEPGLKASYTMALTVPTGYQIITNAPEIGRVPATPGLETVSFATTRPMSTYLLSLAVGPFDVVERPAIPANAFRDHAVPLRGFARKGRGGDLNYILDITPRMLEIFENELQRDYPFEKLDIIAAPQWPSGATELSAAITYREQRILVGDNPAPGARISLISVHAHELAHMWFGNLVTPPWWDDLWLKEGYASWGTPLALTILEPDGGHEISAAASAFAAMQLDSLASTRAIREPIADNDNVRNAYDSITYRKSLGVIHMVDQYFGPEVFRPALGRYIATFADDSADSPQFYEVIGRETQTPALAETFESFVEQKGVPLLHTELQCTDNQVTVRFQQQRYRPLGSSIDAAGYQWTIPLCLRTSKGLRHCEMMVEPQQTMRLDTASCPDWILPNAGGAGYYRWTVSDAQWRALLDDFDSLSPVEALAVLDSAFAAFGAGELAADILWQAVMASSRSTQRQVVSAPLWHLAAYNRHYFNAPQRKALALRAQHLYGPLIAASQTRTDPDQQILYSQLLAFMGLDMDDESARDQLRQQALAFTGFKQERDEQALSSDLYEDALAVAVQDLGKPFVLHLIEMRKALDNPIFESASANALGQISDPDLLPLLHELALSEQLGSREAFGLIDRATASRATASANWRWLVDNFAAVTTKIPEQWRRRTPNFGGDFCDDAGLQELHDLFATHAGLTPGYQRALAQNEERIQLCIALRGQGESLARYLEQ